MIAALVLPLPATYYLLPQLPPPAPNDVPHKLVNLSDTNTICLVVLFTP